MYMLYILSAFSVLNLLPFSFSVKANLTTIGWWEFMKTLLRLGEYHKNSNKFISLNFYFWF